jgi:4-hydroxy-4-methyl-2-oxoglutarate aldolase
MNSEAAQDGGAFRLSGDVGVGLYSPPETGTADFTRIDRGTAERLAKVPGLTSMITDILDELGWRLAVPGSVLAPLHDDGRIAIGHALTLRYLPSRHHLLHPGYAEEPPRLAHRALLPFAQQGDVIVIDATSVPGVSVMGDVAARGMMGAGIGGVIVDGGVRDGGELRESGLPLWVRQLTPISGKHRIDGIAINRPISCCGVQVCAGDLVVADRTGICFVPLEALDAVLARADELSPSGILPDAAGR